MKGQFDKKIYYLTSVYAVFTAVVVFIYARYAPDLHQYYSLQMVLEEQQQEGLSMHYDIPVELEDSKSQTISVILSEDVDVDAQGIAWHLDYGKKQITITMPVRMEEIPTSVWVDAPINIVHSVNAYYQETMLTLEVSLDEICQLERLEGEGLSFFVQPIREVYEYIVVSGAIDEQAQGDIGVDSFSEYIPAFESFVLQRASQKTDWNQGILLVTMDDLVGEEQTTEEETQRLLAQLQPDLFLGLGLTQDADSLRSGVVTYYSVDYITPRFQSLDVATIFMDEFTKIMGGNGNEMRADELGEMIPTGSEMLACGLLLGYRSNPEDLRCLQDAQIQEMLADALLVGIERTCNELEH